MSGCSHDLDQVGFLVDVYAGAYVILAWDKENKCVPDEITKLVDSGKFDELARAGTLPEGYSDIDAAMECVDKVGYAASGFSGTVRTLFPGKTPSPIEKACEPDVDDPVYIPAGKKPDLFKAAYPTPDDLLDEFKSVFAGLHVEFPDGFDWWARVVEVKGTEFF